jgi:hypothetical protein
MTSGEESPPALEASVAAGSWASWFPRPAAVGADHV